MEGKWRSLSAGIKFIITERIITALTRVVDVLMIILISTDPVLGWLKAFFIGGLIYAALCGVIIWVNDAALARGIDLTGLEEVRNLATQDLATRQYLKRFIAWVLSRRRSIFWVGSWFYLDPDYVTLLLRRSNKTFWQDFWGITVPSVIMSMLVWTSVYWCAFRGYVWAKALVNLPE